MQARNAQNNVWASMQIVVASPSWRNIRPIGQMDVGSCWVASLQWLLRCLGRACPTHNELIKKYDSLTQVTQGDDDDPNPWGGMKGNDFLSRVCPRYGLQGGTVTPGADGRLPLGYKPEIILYVDDFGPHYSVVFDQSSVGGGWMVDCMDPYYPLQPAKGTQRTGHFVTRATSYYLRRNRSVMMFESKT